MAVNFVLIAYVWFFIPETKKVPLEEMDVLFGGVNHVEKGSQLVGLGPDNEIKDVEAAERRKKEDEAREV